MALALSLSRGGIPTTLLEKGLALFDKANDSRVYALSAGNADFLRDLGVWEQLKPHATPIHTIRVQESGSLGGVLFDHPVRHGSSGENLHGYMIPSTALCQVLHKAVRDCSEITYQTETAVTHVHQDSDSVTLTLQQKGPHKTTLRGNVVFAADGKNSMIKRLLEISEEKFSYDHAALICNVTHTKPHHNGAVEVFTPLGPLAFLPLQGNKSACVFSMAKRLGDSYVRQSMDVFTHKLEELFPDYGTYTLDTPLSSFPLVATFSPQPARNRVMLCGDAAMTIHPVAGQGLNYGLKDVRAIYDNIAQMSVDGDIPTVLCTIQNARMTDRRIMLHATDGIIRIFALKTPGIRCMRQVGMSLINLSPSIKWLFTERAGA